MTNSIRTAILGAASAMIASPAFADDANGGVYAGANAGVNFASDGDFAGVEDGLGFDAGYSFGGVVGYKFPEQSFGNFRVELEGNYAEDGMSDAIGFGAAPGAVVEGETQNASAMVNFYYDLSQLGGRFTPFVGVGAGFSNIDLDYRSPTLSYSDDATEFAYQAIAGVRYDINDRWSMSIDGRYVGVSDPKFDLAAGLPATPEGFAEYEYDSLRATFGVQYSF